MSTLVHLVADIGNPAFRKYSYMAALSMLGAVTELAPYLPEKYKPVAATILLVLGALGVKGLKNEPTEPAK